MELTCCLCGEEIESEEYILNQSTVMPQGETDVRFFHYGCAEALGEEYMEGAE